MTRKRTPVSPAMKEDLEAVTHHRNRTRATKEAAGEPKVVKEKFVEERAIKVYEVQPKSENQKKFLDALKTKQLVIGEGRAGVGKSHLACIHAANSYLKGQCSRIVLLRPYVQVGKTAGLLPGTLQDKLRPLMLPMLDNLQLVLGRERFMYMLEHEQICIEAVENVRGRSYRDSIVILDESQNVSPEEIKAMVTRLEETSQLVIIGDTHQSDLKGTTGLAYIVQIIKQLRVEKPEYLDAEDMSVLFENTACITFTAEDIVRSGLTRLFVKVFDNQ